MSDRDKRAPEEKAGANIKAMRAKLGLTQAELAEAMQGLGHSWIQTTVAKTEAADRPLRVNEAADLAQILGTRLALLVGSQSDWERQAIQNTLRAYMAHADRLKSEIDELTRQVEVKAQALEEAWKRVQELQVELDPADG